MLKSIPTVLIFLLALAWTDTADGEVAGTQRGPIEAYMSPTQEVEIALARSAAPPSISRNATILVLDRAGYETAVRGDNGFTCLVERSWAADFDDAEFWNPKTRGPLCFNPAASRSVLPAYIERTKWVLSGAEKDELLSRTREAVRAMAIRPPEPGSMCYMLSKEGYLNGAGGHWHPHLMFYVPRTEAAAWGANAAGSPVMGGPLMVEPSTIFIALVPAWSDGTPAMVR